MSLNRKSNVKCPSCANGQEVTIWDSITVKDSPDLKAELLKGNINMFICDACGVRALLPAPMLYNDEEKRLLFSFTPCQNEGEALAAYSELVDNSKNALDMDKFEGYNLRFVSEYNDMLEKILIFDAGLLDKTIELLKLMVLNSEPDKADQRKCFFGKKEGDVLEFAVYDSKENQMYTSQVPFSTYTTVETEMLNSGVKRYSFGWERINADYAASLL